MGALLLSALVKGMGKREPYTMAVCTSHEQPVPMIWTFAFAGSEYWCPECGKNLGMWSAEKVSGTPELKKRLKELTKATDKYLDARSALTCDEINYRGKWIKPKDLPEKVIAKYKKIIKDFEDAIKQKQSNDQDENI